MSRRSVRPRPYVHPVYGECHSWRPRSMPRLFDELAAYNTRRAQGIVHTPEFESRMIDLQREFDHWAMEEVRDGR